MKRVALRPDGVVLEARPIVKLFRATGACNESKIPARHIDVAGIRGVAIVDTSFLLRVREDFNVVDRTGVTRAFELIPP